LWTPSTAASGRVRYAGVAAEELDAELGDDIDLAMQYGVAFERDALQLVVLLARLDLQRRPRIHGRGRAPSAIW